MILDQFKLDGKVAMVTGASRGLGQGMAWALAEAGADVACVARGDLSETVDGIRQRGRRGLPLHADLASLSCIDDILPPTREALGGPDILVNNAGFTHRAAFVDFTEEQWDDVMAVNLKMAFFLSQACVRQWVEQKRRGKIIHIASMLSFQGGVRVGSYTASKSGLLGVTRIMANELAPHGINVNAIAPGYFATAATQPLLDNEQRNAEILARIPAGHWGQPDELGGAVVFLASAASDYVHGAILAVDGGWLCR